MMFETNFGTSYKLGVLAGLESGHATKLPWLGDSSNTAKQLVLLVVERFPRKSVLALQEELKGQLPSQVQGTLLGSVSCC